MEHTESTPSLPRWAQLLRERYLAGEASTFVLYGNVFDIILVGNKFVDLKAFITDMFVANTKSTVVEVSGEFGVKTSKGIAEIDKGGTLIEQLHSLERHLRTSDGTAVYVPYADTIMPSDDAGFVSEDDRKVGTLFHRWSLDRTLNASDNITFIVTETLSALNQRLLSNPKVAAIEIPMPDLACRLAVVSNLCPDLSVGRREKYAEWMAGLRSVQIESVVRPSGSTSMSLEDRETLIRDVLKGTPNADVRAKRFAGLTGGMTADEIVALVGATQEAVAGDPDEDVLKLITSRKRDLIAKECAGLLEFVDTKHGLDAVGGCDHLFEELTVIARSMKEGDGKLAPMGLLAVGPMGAGKTFVLKAFIKDAGLSAVALKNIRSKWVGSTERNLEKVLATIKVMGPIAVLIDEADRSFGSSGGDGDDGTSSRMMARLKEFMSDTDNRGNVLFIMMTNRPDKLDTDIKRPGRFDRKLPFFYCQSAEERANVVSAVLKRYDAKLEVDLKLIAGICESLDGYSNADLEAMTLLGLELLHRNPGSGLEDALKMAKDDFMPPQEKDMICFMEMLAVSETSRRSLLPAKFRALSLEEIKGQLREARARAIGQ